MWKTHYVNAPRAWCVINWMDEMKSAFELSHNETRRYALQALLRAETRALDFEYAQKTEGLPDMR